MLFVKLFCKVRERIKMFRINVNELSAITKARNKNNHFNVYSSIIKRERLLQNMTLEETAAGICSVSYLCKLENNQIEPRTEYIKFLFERLAIDYSLVKSNDYETILREIIRCYFYEDYGKIEDIIKTIDFSLFDCNAILCKIFLLLSNHLEEEASKLLEEVDTVKNCLSDYGAIIFGFLISEYYIKTNQFHEAYKCLYSICDDYIDDDNLQYLLDEDKIICAFHTKKHFEAERLINKLLNSVNISYPTSRRAKINIINSIILGLDESTTKLDILTFIKTNKNVIDDYDNYYLAILGLIKLKMFHEVIEIIENSGLYVRCGILALYGAAIYCLKLTNKYLAFIELSKVVQKESPNDQNMKFIEFMTKYIQNEDKIVLYEYLKFDALVFSDKYPHVLFDELYLNNYLDLLVSLSKYKDATILLKDSYFFK